MTALALDACGPGVVTADVRTRFGPNAVVSVIHGTGWLRTASVPANPALLDAGVPSASNPSADPSMLRISWGAGPCLETATITIHATEPVSIDVVSSELGGAGRCNEQVLAGYVVDLSFDRAIPAANIVVTDLTPQRVPNG